MPSLNTIERYDAMRTAARDISESMLQSQLDDGLFDDATSSFQGVKIEVTPIDADALDAWQETWCEHPDRRYGWDWKSERKGWQTTLRRIDAAIWADGELCGLMIGCVTKGRNYARVDLLEGAPDVDHPLKKRVAYCVTEIALAFADIFECSNVVLMNPVEDAVPLYESLGFALAETRANIRCCIKKV